MEANKKEQKFFYKVLNKMFKLVGFKGYDQNFTKKKEWYKLRSWDKKQEDKFRKYFILNAKKDLKYSIKNANREFLWFNLVFGWKRKD